MTRAPLPPASRTRSRTSVVFPIPASPPTSTSRPAPLAATASSSRKMVCSRDRPTRREESVARVAAAVLVSITTRSCLSRLGCIVLNSGGRQQRYPELGSDQNPVTTGRSVGGGGAGEETGGYPAGIGWLAAIDPTGAPRGDHD